MESTELMKVTLRMTIEEVITESDAGKVACEMQDGKKSVIL